MLTPLQPGPSAHAKARYHVLATAALRAWMQPVVDRLVREILAEVDRLIIPKARWRERARLVRLLNRRVNSLAAAASHDRAHPRHVDLVHDGRIRGL